MSHKSWELAKAWADAVRHDELAANIPRPTGCHAYRRTLQQNDSIMHTLWHDAVILVQKFFYMHYDGTFG
jgi:hypothetical protein